MYFLFMVLGLVISGLISDWNNSILGLGVFIGLLISVILKYLVKWYKTTHSSVFDGCLLWYGLIVVLESLE